MSRLPETQAASCPPPDRLERVAHGVATDEEEAAVAQHLDDCVACRARFEALLSLPEHLSGLGQVDLDRAVADREAIRSHTRVPHAIASSDDGAVELECGLRLGPPREPGFIASMGEFDVVARSWARGGWASCSGRSTDRSGVRWP